MCCVLMFLTIQNDWMVKNIKTQHIFGYNAKKPSSNDDGKGACDDETEEDG